MRKLSLLMLVIFSLAIAHSAIGFQIPAARAQSQEPKPGRGSATPPITEATPAGPSDATGLGDASWQSPTWGVQISWDPDIWIVENELIEPSYEGLQLGSDASTVYIEAYEGFNGSAEECLTAAEQEIAERPNTREVTRLSGRQLPESIADSDATQLFGVVAELPDGSIYRGAEFVACHSLATGAAVLEVTWQTATAAYNDELPRVSELFASLTLPEDAGS